VIVIPMAGLSKRFTDAGYNGPKYMLEAHGKSLFAHSVNSFEKYFQSEKFLFIYREVEGAGTFVREETAKLGISNCVFVKLEQPTRGQAETVMLGLQQANVEAEETLLIFNIDTFRPGFQLPRPSVVENWDGYLEVFEGEGDHWSFVLPASFGSTRVKETAEKRRISNLCSTGLYYFRTYQLFEKAFLAEVRAQGDAELFVAPIYNHLIHAKAQIHFTVIEQDAVTFCGVPSEYEEFLRCTPPPSIITSQKTR